MGILSAKGARSPLLALSVFIVAFIVGFMVWQSVPRVPFPRSHGSTHHVAISTVPETKAAPVSMEEIMRLLFTPLKIEPDQPTFTDLNGTAHTLPPNPRYRKKLGKNVLVLDLETRSLESDKAWKKGIFNWMNLDHLSGGVFQHYTYALIHNYDYKFIKAPKFWDRHSSWIKPSAIANQLHDYEFIVFLDADAAVHNMHLPIEWLMNYWDVEPKHSITMAKDPWEPEHPEINSDRFNRTLTNTGFMIIQNNPTAHEILKAWHECPDDTRYVGCSKWKKPRFHEQSAFGEFIRYDYEDNIKELECKEANGAPDVEVSDCKGTFIRHYWFEKHNVKLDFQENMMQAITVPFQRTFMDNWPRVIYTQDSNKII
ncbi:hypothetical protein BCR34DRAFT_491149 [Clohesyomyces aquaticus]|uniref:Nucleotide-diphospho-sugar transferase domain-containing protein n=1 Tax=Clohesyomyces aquaticus TaxID=1231657 RepID=A0A1Y1Z3Z4_9PLEO|nr:hypothetical protein BCR34DRAFT_491149 [Clohesyomyces aquaticus]